MSKANTNKARAFRKSMTRAEFGAMLGEFPEVGRPLSSEAIRRYEEGLRIPRLEVMRAYYWLSKGKVKPQHFCPMPDLKG